MKKIKFPWSVSCWLLCAVVALGQQTAALESRWEKDIKAFEAADHEAPPPKSAVVFVGSSSIRMWKDLAQDFPKTKVINRGFGGSQIADSVQFADRIIIPYQPRMVVLYAGDNDLAAGKSPQQVFEDYKAFVGRVREKLPNARIAFLSIKPSLARLKLMDQIQQTNRLVRDFASAGKALDYIDVYTPMLNAEGLPKPELFLKDGLHMNREGYAIWTKAATPFLK
jgi:lysophospholipase L1-like esterase